MATTKTAALNALPQDVAQVRKVAGLTLSAAAALIGFSQSALQKWESGTRPMSQALFALYVKAVQDYVDAKNPNFNTRPAEGSVWTHRKSDYDYTVVLVTSQPDKAQAEQHPVQVIYRSATTGKTWARGLVAFHQAFVEKPFKVATGGKAVPTTPKIPHKPAAKKPAGKPSAATFPAAAGGGWPFPTTASSPAPSATVKVPARKAVARKTTRKA